MRKSLHLEMDLTLEPRFTKEFVVKKNDDITLDIALKNDRLPVVADNQVARLFVRKQDGSVIVQGGTEELGDGSIVIGGNVVRIHLKNSATNTTGLCYAELELQDESGVMATHSFIFEVIDRLDNIDEAIKATDDIYILKELEEFIIQAKKDIAEIREILNQMRADMEQAVEDFNNAVKDFEEKLEGTNTDIDEKVAHFEELIAGLEGRIEDFENAYKDVGEELALLKEEAIVEIDNLRKWSINDLEDRHGLYQESLAQAYANYSRKIKEQATLSKLEIQRAGEEIVAVLDTVKNNAVIEMTNLHTQYMMSLDEKFESSIGEIEEKMGQALRNISDATESSLEAIQDKADDIMEQIENIEIGSIEGVEIAVADAQKRLQEEAIKQNWNIQQAGKEEGDRLIASLGQKTSELKDNLEATTNNHIENINQAGQQVFEAVDNLEANIEQGLTDINNTINTGKKDIKDLSDSYLNRIETEGEEIIEAVRDLEITTTNNIERINEAGLSARQSIESKANAEVNTINSIVGNRKQEINELTENKKEEIITAGDEKLAEIREIVTTTEEDVVELLETTRNEINAHRTTINETVNEGLENISNLKSSSISEMTATKDNLLEEILGAEVELKEDFNTLHSTIIENINNTANDKIENMNSTVDNKVESIDRLLENIKALELEIERNLVNADKKAENLEKTLENVDTKIADITPVLDGLDELRELCNELIAQNETASNSLEELEFWTTEADVRIVELRRLIEEVKNLELELQAYIDAKGGNHDEILLRLDALEESVIALDDTIAQLGNIYATIKDLEANYATKKELKTSIEEAMKSTGLKVVGKLGTGLKIATELMPTKLKELKTPEHLIDTYGEVKHTYVYEAYPSNGKQTWYKIIFFCNLDDPQNTGKYVSFESGVFTFNGLERGKDYAIATTTSTFSEDPFYVDTSLSTINHNDSRTYSYYIDFNLYDKNGEEILVNNPQKAGISNLDNATSAGFYILDMDMADYKELSNAPNLEGSVAKGYLEVINDTQKLSIVDGQVFIRKNGGAWTRVDNNRKNTIATVGKSTAIKTPQLFKNAPATLRAFHRNKERIVMFRATEDDYYVIRINSSYEYALSHNNTKFTINGSYNPGLQTFRYRVSDGEWYNKLFYTTSIISSQDIAINQNFFEVYHSDFDITNTVNNKWSIQKGLVASYDVEETINDFNNAIEAGYYNVNIESVSDGVSNSPKDSIQGILKVEKNKNVIYQELTPNDNKAVFKRVFDNNWSSWRYIGDEYLGVVGLTPKASIDKNGVFDNVPNPPTIRGSEYIGKYMHSYLNSSKQYYVCTYLYKNTDTNKTPYLSTTEYTNNTGSYHSVYGYDYDGYTCRTFMKYEGDSEWSTSTSIQSMTDLQTAHIYYNDVSIYTGGKDKTGIYREAMNADVIGDLDNCRKAGKYYVNVSKDEYNKIGNMPQVKVEKDIETTLYVNIQDSKTLQEITIEGVTYTRVMGEKWIGLNSTFVKNDVIAHIKGVESEATVDYEIETVNIEDIYASCPVANNHKEPYGTIDFKDSSGKYYRFVTYGKGSGFYLYQSGSSKTVGAYAYDQRYITRYTWDNGVWTEWSPTSSSYTYTYVSIGAGEILNSNLDVCKGTSNTAYDKTTIVRKADVKSDIKTIYDFNEANIEGRYVVNIEENKEALNAPTSGVLSGTLEVIKVDNMIKQLFTDNTREYTRVFNEEWTEWKSAGLTTETVEAMINAMLGVPKTELISDINEIIRGI